MEAVVPAFTTSIQNISDQIALLPPGGPESKVLVKTKDTLVKERDINRRNIEKKV